jgi:hypothetical protein
VAHSAGEGAPFTFWADSRQCIARATRRDGTTGRDGQMGVECRVEQSIAEPVRSSDHDSGAARVKSLDSGQVRQ